MVKNFASYCDRDIKFFETLEEAEAQANLAIDVSRCEAVDGWDEPTTEGIVVLQVIRRAEKIDPNVDYRCVDYRLSTIVDVPAANVIAKLRQNGNRWEVILANGEVLADSKWPAAAREHATKRWREMGRPEALAIVEAD